jgi:hypothetical protein
MSGSQELLQQLRSVSGLNERFVHDGERFDLAVRGILDKGLSYKKSHGQRSRKPSIA